MSTFLDGLSVRALVRLVAKTEFSRKTSVEGETIILPAPAAELESKETLPPVMVRGPVIVLGPLRLTVATDAIVQAPEPAMVDAMERLCPLMATIADAGLKERTPPVRVGVPESMVMPPTA
jgi:hypothetical protein